MPDYSLGFVGTGQMASALAAGFVKSADIAPESIMGYDISDSARSRFSQQIRGAKIAATLAELVGTCDLIFLAVKPQVIPEIVGDLQPLDPSVVYVSVMGGITLSWLKNHLQTDQVIRVMPNTPCLIGEGVSGVAPSSAVDDETVDDVIRMLNSVGRAYRLPERMIDAVTGTSGSGPAFVFQFIEAFSDGAVLNGLPRDLATEMAAQTVLGAAQMVLSTGEHPAVLKDRVASPAGTTIAGLNALERNGLRGAVIEAVTEASKRSIELGKNQ